MCRLLVLLVVAFAAAAQPPLLTDEDKAQGWRLLFDGVSTAGWGGGIGVPFPERAWAIEDGVLHLKDPRAGTSIYSNEKFDNFELSFEWKIGTGGDSGLQYLSVPGRRAPDFVEAWQSWVRGLIIGGVLLVVYVIALAMRRGALKQKWAYRIAVAIGIFMSLWVAALGWGIYRGREWASRYPAGPEYQIGDGAGGVTRLIEARGAAAQPGEWNQSRILVNGEDVEHWLNGMKVVEYRFGSAEFERAVAASKFKVLEGFTRKQAGHLALVNSGSEVWFRNLKIRPTSGSSSAP